MRKVTVASWAAAILVTVVGSQSARAQDFCVLTSLSGGGTRNFGASLMSVKGSTAAITLVDLASVNVIGFGALNVNQVFLAPVSLAWTVVADGITEQYDCRLFLPTYSGAGNQLTVRNTGNSLVQLTTCRITALPCP